MTLPDNSACFLQGRFEILYLSGTYNLNGEEGSQSRSNGLSICLSSPNGRVIGGRVSGVVIAATHVQVIYPSSLFFFISFWK